MRQDALGQIPPRSSGCWGKGYDGQRARIFFV